MSAHTPLLILFLLVAGLPLALEACISPNDLREMGIRLGNSETISTGDQILQSDYIKRREKAAGGNP